MKILTVTTDEQMNEAFAIREIVFIDEQNVPPERERDEYDLAATHVIGYLQENPIATGRFRPIDDYGKLERVAVLKEFRGQSYGRQVIAYMEQLIHQAGYKKSVLNAQTHAASF